MDRITRRNDRDGEVKIKLWVDVLCRNEKGDVPCWYLHVRRINFESIWRSSYAKGTMLEFLEISLTNISWFSKLYKYARVDTIIKITVNFDYYIFLQIQVYLFLRFVQTHWETRIDIHFFQTITHFIVVATKKKKL